MRKKKRKTTDLATIASRNFSNDDVIYGLMFSFIKNNYPIVKIKEKNRFKRGIIIDGKKYLLPRDNNTAFFTLFSILDMLYGVHEDITTLVIKNYYNLS